MQFEEDPYGDEMGSILADIVAQFAQDVRCLSPVFFSFLFFFSHTTSSKGATAAPHMDTNEDNCMKNSSFILFVLLSPFKNLIMLQS